MKKYDPLEAMEPERLKMAKKYSTGEISEQEYKIFMIYTGFYKIVDGVQISLNKSEEDKR